MHCILALVPKLYFYLAYGSVQELVFNVENVSHLKKFSQDHNDVVMIGEFFLIYYTFYYY